MKVAKFYHRFFVIMILSLITFAFVFADDNVYRKIINNNFQKNLTNSLSFDLKGSQSITGQGFKRLVSDFSLRSSSVINIIDFNKSDNYLNFNGFVNEDKGYFDLNLGLSNDNQEWINLNFETRFFPKKKSLYFLLKNFNFALTEKDLLEFSTSTLCTKDIISLVTKVNSFLDREIENRWLKFDIDLKTITTKEEESLSINEIKNYLVNYPIFTLAEIKSPDKQLRKFELIVNKDNLINLERLYIKVLSNSTSTVDRKKSELIAEMFSIFFDKKVGEVYINKKDFKIKKVSFQLRPSNLLKIKYDLNFKLDFNLEPNAKLSKDITQPSTHLKFDDLSDKFIEFASKEASLFLSIETNCRRTQLINIKY